MLSLQPVLAAATAPAPVSDYLPEAPGLAGFRLYTVSAHASQSFVARAGIASPKVETWQNLVVAGGFVFTISRLKRIANVLVVARMPAPPVSSAVSLT